MNYIDVLNLYYVGAAAIILFFTFYSFVSFRRTDKKMLKARIFLNDDILSKTWAYGAIIGMSFAVHEILSSPVVACYIPYLCEMMKLIFLTAVLGLIYEWYDFGRT
ncbi:MAG: hypothetical protein QMC78_03880 [Methanocellales archaeon]|nr:hypothetical protein [Methanocellales archaeon]